MTNWLSSTKGKWKAPRYQKVGAARHGSAWDPDEDKHLLTVYNGNLPLSVIAGMHQRTINSIQTRLWDRYRIPFDHKRPNMDTPTYVLWSTADQAALDALIERKKQAEDKRREAITSLVKQMYYRSIGDDEIVAALIENAPQFVRALTPFLQHEVTREAMNVATSDISQRDVAIELVRKTLGYSNKSGVAVTVVNQLALVGLLPESCRNPK